MIEPLKRAKENIYNGFSLFCLFVVFLLLQYILRPILAYFFFIIVALGELRKTQSCIYIPRWIVFELWGFLDSNFDHSAGKRDRDLTPSPIMLDGPKGREPR